MHILKSLFLAITLLSVLAGTAFAEIKVVTSIKPVHSLVAAVMEGIAEPDLLVDGAASAHNYALKPSQAKMLEAANIVFWIGHELETFLEKPLSTIGANARSIELIDAQGLIKLGFREGDAFEKEHHDDQTHEETSEAGHDDDPEHGHGEFDAHIWLDPENAKAMVLEIRDALIAADPKNASAYRTNADTVNASLARLVSETSKKLEPVKGKGFIVFHDAYQYFEKRFGVLASGSIAVSPEIMPGARRIVDIRSKVQEMSAICVFSEPQFEPKIIGTVTEGTNAKPGIIDPLGATLENGPDLYFKLIRNMAASIQTCLSEAS